MTLLAPAPKLTNRRAAQTADMYTLFAEDHVSPANTVEDGIQYILDQLAMVEPQNGLYFHGPLLAQVSGPTLRVRFPLAVPTAEQVTTSVDPYTLFTDGGRGVALPTGEWLSHPAVVSAPGQMDDELYLASWVLEDDALERVENAGVTGAYARTCWAVGIRTLDGVLDAWDGGVPTEYLLAMDGAL